MRRFKAPGEIALDGYRTLAHWRANESDTATRMYATALPNTTLSSATTSRRLDFVEIAGESYDLEKVAALQADGRAAGANQFRYGWYSAASATAHAVNLRTDYSVSFWIWNDPSLPYGATAALFEYSAASVANDANRMSAAGLYRNLDGRLRVFYDIDVGGSATQQFFDTGGYLPNGAQDGRARLVTYTARAVGSRAEIKLYLDDALIHTQASAWWPNQSPASSNWIFFASKRFSSNATGTTPSLILASAAGDEIIRFNDIVVHNRTMSHEQVRERFGAGMRTWDEATLARTGQYRVLWRALVQRSNGDWVHLDSYRGKNWCRTASVSDSTEDLHQKASIVLARRFGKHLDLSVLNEEADLTYGLDSRPLVDLRRHMQVQYAVVPTDWAVQGWEWEVAFDGLVDSVDWGGDVVRVACTDRGAALADAYRMDARRYEYGVAGTPSEDHLQTLINDNSPFVATDDPTGATASGWSPGYLLGTPRVFAPFQSDWSLRYDHSPASGVDRLLANTADQIAWDCRFRYYAAWAEDRLTYTEPPRTNTLVLTRVEKHTDTGLTRVTLGGSSDNHGQACHGMQVGQACTVMFTTNFNGGGRVARIINHHTVELDFGPGGSPSAEGSGELLYGPAFTLTKNHIRSVGDVSTDVSGIRNHIVIRYGRSETGVTVPLWYYDADSDPGNLIVSTTPGVDLRQLQAGAEVTITNAGDGPAALLGTRVVVSSATQLLSMLTLTPAGGVTGAALVTGGVMQSEYMNYQQMVFTNTASVVKYGMRSAGVFEGSIEGIDTYVEASRLGEGILSDLANPTVDMRLQVKCFPWVELHDLLAIEPDELGRWTGTRNLAVVGYTHNFGPECSTELSLRHDHPSKGHAWLNRSGIIMGDMDPGFPGININDLDIGLPEMNTNIGQSWGFNGPRHNHPGPRQQGWLWDRTEVVIRSAVSLGFDGLNRQTMSFRGNAGMVPAHTFTPGVTQYAQFRSVDKYGNRSMPGPTAAFVPRFLTKPPAARLLNTSTTARNFVDSVSGASSPWRVFPFESKTNSGCFDNYGNMAFIANTAQYAWHSSTAFVMPCDGTCSIEGEVYIGMGSGVTFSKGYGMAGLGIFRKGSAAGLSESVPYRLVSPFQRRYSTQPWVPTPGHAPELGNKAFTYGTGLPGTVATLFGYSATFTFTTGWFYINEQITANSGDRVFLAWRADSLAANGASNTSTAWHAAGGTNNSTPWIQYTLLTQQ